MTRIKTIEIYPVLPTYFITNSSMMKLDNSSDEFIRHVGQARYVDDRCMNAKISAQNWLYDLGDTVWFMLHDCDPIFTSINSVKKITKPKFNHDITTSQDYQLKKWIESVKQNCLLEYGKCK